MEITMLYMNAAGEYLADIAPVKFVASGPSIPCYTVTFDLESISDEDFVRNEIVGLCEQVLEGIPDNSFTLIFDDKATGEHIYKLDVNTMKVMGAYSKTLTLTDEINDQFSAFVAIFMSVVPDMWLRLKMSRMASSTVGAIRGMLGGSKMSAKPTDDVDKIIADIEENTKADIVKPKETLADYVSTPRLKEELEEIVNLFKNSVTYKGYGLNLPKGVLLKGPPGTGKTFAAKCIAGTTDAWFMTCTASSLQGQYIGSGTQNIKQVFDGAKLLAEKSKKGVIIFMDELDSLGSRDSHRGGGGSEEDRTLNQLLAEMSGFDAEDYDIMLIGATNYAERLDDALLRSGRFGRQITIDYPDEHERMEMIKHYYGKIKIPREASADDATLSDLMDGLTPADIAEIANESGIMTVRHGNKEIMLDDINETINRTITKNVRSEDGPTKLIELISAHEAGHALMEIIYEKRFPIKMTSYGYGDAGGFTQSSKPASGITSKEKYMARIMTLLGGRAAEQTICGFVTTGASSDLMKAKRMLTDYFKTYDFEQHDVTKVEQLVEDKLNELYGKAVAKMAEPDILKWLTNMTAQLMTDRVMYKTDIIALTPRAYAKGALKIC